MQLRERMGSFVGLIPALGAALVIVFMAPSATARNDALEVKVETAKQYAGKMPLGPMPFYLAGQRHPKVTKSHGEMRTDKRTVAFGKTDERACSIAFQSAILQLQKRAGELGGNAIVDIKTVTAGTVSESTDSFRCAAGNVVANVALTGRAVTIAK